MSPTLERLFHLSENGTTVRTELLAGSTTFFTLAYIIFVKPTVLSAAGLIFLFVGLFLVRYAVLV